MWLALSDDSVSLIEPYVSLSPCSFVFPVDSITRTHTGSCA